MAAAAILHRYRSYGPLRYWKPVQTGIEEDDDTATVRELAACAEVELLTTGVRLPRPLSPHLSAQLAGESIQLEPLLDAVSAEPRSPAWVVEGAGGVLVPLNETDLMIDLMRRLRLPVLVVSRTALGTINHTLLTIEALRARSLDVAGVLLVGEPKLGTRDAIERYGKVAVVGELPPLDPLSADTLGAWAASAFDREGHLARYLVPAASRTGLL